MSKSLEEYEGKASTRAVERCDAGSPQHLPLCLFSCSYVLLSHSLHHSLVNWPAQLYLYPRRVSRKVRLRGSLSFVCIGPMKHIGADWEKQASQPPCWPLKRVPQAGRAVPSPLLSDWGNSWGMRGSRTKDSTVTTSWPSVRRTCQPADEPFPWPSSRPAQQLPDRSSASGAAMSEEVSSPIHGIFCNHH